jgi:uncharacterized protein (DUF2141 family)
MTGMTTALLSVMLAASAPAALAAPLTMTVRARGFRNASGQALIALYRSSDTWLKIDRAFRRTAAPIRDGAVEVRFDALPSGDYAVAVIHDSNGNGRLDMRWFPWPKPKEGAGVSNGASGGPPKWRDAKLALDADRTVDVTLTY